MKLVHWGRRQGGETGRERENMNAYQIPEPMKISSLVTTLQWRSQQNPGSECVHVPQAVLPPPNGWQSFLLSSYWFLINVSPAPLGSSQILNKGCWESQLPNCYSHLAEANPMGPLFPESSFDHSAQGQTFQTPLPMSLIFECVSLFAAGKLIKLPLCHYKCIPGSPSSVGVTAPVLRPGREGRGPQNIETRDTEGQLRAVLRWDKQKSLWHNSWIHRTLSHAKYVLQTPQNLEGENIISSWFIDC